MEPILSQAMERERDYDWLGAVEFYTKALSLMSETDFLKMGQVQERVGYAFYRAAMQAETVDQFRDRMSLAIANYGNAKDLYGKISEAGKTPRILRCDAAIAYVRYWLAPESVKKKRLVDECWRLTKEALRAFDEAGHPLEYGKTYNQLASSACFSWLLEWSSQACEKTLREAIDCGERAVTLLSAIKEPYEVARAYVNTADKLETFGFLFCDMDEMEKYCQRFLGYWQKAVEFSEEAALLELVSMGYVGESAWNIDERLTIYEKALGLARKTRDKSFIGNALHMLADDNFSKAYGTDDNDERTEIFKRALHYAEDAKRQFSSISFVSLGEASLFFGAEYYWTLTLWETDLKKRRSLLEKAVADGTQGMKLAESTGYPGIIFKAHHTLSKALGSLAQMETNLEEKRKLLEKALEHRSEATRITEQVYSVSYWVRGLHLNYLADLKSEMSNFEKDSEKKKRVLEGAASDKERCLQLCSKEIPHMEKIDDRWHLFAFARFQYSYGELLNRLYGLTNNDENQRKAMKVFEEAAESFQKLDMVSRIAECHWKVARGYDVLGDHLKAAENFNLASNNFTEAVEKLPQLKDFYRDYALYMQAWSEIEKARQHHVRQEYDLAREQYEKAAIKHKSLRQWSYLVPNYSAWAQVEGAESLSRKEVSEEAIRAFQLATELFTETKGSIQTELRKIEDVDEKQMASNLIKITDLRREYCAGRVSLEEAKIFDRKGDHYSSSEKYGSAAETFEKITQTLESEQDRKEFKLIATLARAWQKMAQAEAEVSPTLYLEASQLFEEAKNLSLSGREKTLALGHSRFCKALEAGTRFADTRDETQHTIAIEQLESAANYYIKAGYQTASEYAKATELLLDAYMHIDDAKKEKDPEKKAKLYAMVEKILQQSAASFIKAEQPEKRQQVLRLLDTVKEERELAVSLSEVLHAPSIVSTTTAFTTPAPTYENSVGLERFEHADIQANVIARQKSLNVGESLDLEIELVNAGKGPGVLIKLAEVIPEGFELTQKPEIYRVEDSFLNMKGRRLDALKTEEVRLVLKPRVRGVFPLKPRIDYLDEDGKYKSHQPEPVTITVKELGIKGWLKGQ